MMTVIVFVAMSLCLGAIGFISAVLICSIVLQVGQLGYAIKCSHKR